MRISRRCRCGATWAFLKCPAIAFVTRLAFEAEAHDHHPDMLVSFRNVTVTWSTHSAGGVTEKDVSGARQADRIRAGMAPDGA